MRSRVRRIAEWFAFTVFVTALVGCQGQVVGVKPGDDLNNTMSQHQKDVITAHKNRPIY